MTNEELRKVRHNLIELGVALSKIAATEDAIDILTDVQDLIELERQKIARILDIDPEEARLLEGMNDDKAEHDQHVLRDRS